MWLLVLLCLIIGTFLLPTSNGKYCIMRSVNSGLPSFGSKIKDCTFIDGFLYMRIYADDDVQLIQQLMEDLNRIEYVTGYVYLSAVSSHFTKFSMKKLQIIYGEFLYQDQFSLFIEGNDFTQLDLRSLKLIGKGNVGLRVAQLPCHYKYTINYNEILENPNLQQVLPFKSYNHCRGQEAEDAKNFACHANCDKINGKAYCYGTEEEQCQKATRCTQQNSNSQRCYFDKNTKTEKNCDSLCAGGCFNVSVTGCYGCVGIRYKGECLKTCPQGTYQWQRTCVDSCPKMTLTSETACVWSCPDGFTNVNGFCTKCDLNNCPKSCKLLDANGNHYNLLPRSALLSVKDCEYIIGSVIIGEFRKKAGYDDPITSIDDFMSLSKVKRIDGVLHLYFYYLPEQWKNDTKFQSAFFLKNLEEVNEIKSPNIFPLPNAFSSTPFVYLGLASLKKFNASSLKIRDNPKLKYIESVNWNKLGATNVKYFDNSPQTESCDPSCNVEWGCMGPGPEQCLKNLQK